MTTTYGPNYLKQIEISPNYASKVGWGAALQNLMGYGVDDYSLPDYYASELTAPAQAEYYQTQALDPMGRIDTPGFLSLEGGDYDAWERALRESGQQAFRSEARDLQADLKANLGAGGLYGSSILGDAFSDLNERWTRGIGDIANQAKLQRMGMQQADLAAQNQFNLQAARDQMLQESNLYDAAMADQQRMDLYNLGKTQWDLGQDQQQIDFLNKQIAGQYAHDLMADEWRRNIDDTLFEKAVAMGSGGDAGHAARRNAKAAWRASTQNDGGGVLGALGGLAGGYFQGALENKSWNPFSWF